VELFVQEETIQLNMNETFLIYRLLASLYLFQALTKFLKCVNWKLNGEVRQALDMLQQWTPMDVEDALELLSSNFTHPAVRRYAVTRLKQAPDEVVRL
jgi:phosphatidylinositol 3-kinase